jgi:hypothetical protein
MDTGVNHSIEDTDSSTIPSLPQNFIDSELNYDESDASVLAFMERQTQVSESSAQLLQQRAAVATAQAQHEAKATEVTVAAVKASKKGAVLESTTTVAGPGSTTTGSESSRLAVTVSSGQVHESSDSRDRRPRKRKHIVKHKHAIVGQTQSQVNKLKAKRWMLLQELFKSIYWGVPPKDVSQRRLRSLFRKHDEQNTGVVTMVSLPLPLPLPLPPTPRCQTLGVSY